MNLKTIKETLLGIGIIVFLLGIFLIPNNITPLESMYLDHLKAKEDAINRKFTVATEFHCEAPKNPTEQQMESFLACTDRHLDNLNMITVEAFAIHQKRLRLDVKWGIASKEDAKELGWNYPRPEWDGHNWTCPAGTNPYAIEIEKRAGALAFVHCLSQKEAVEASELFNRQVAQ
jgi:hypothetical protein